MKVLLNCLLMLTVSGFGWSILTEGKAFTSMVPRLIPALGFIVLYLVIFLLPLCYKVEKREGDMPMHEEEKRNMLDGQQIGSPDNSSLSLFESPTGILRSKLIPKPCRQQVLTLKENMLQVSRFEPAQSD